MTFEHLFFPSKITPKNLDEHWMWQALQLATLGYGFTKPNPMVGAILVSDQGEVINKGFHSHFGADHAELATFKQVPTHTDLSHATLYCTLEPCCHVEKKTPPCLPLILERKVKRVVIGCLDPNPKVSGKSVEALKKHGIDVTVGVLEKSAQYLIREFITWQMEQRPYLHLKMALTLDGSFGPDDKLLSREKWMTNDKAKNYVHYLRAGVDAILVGGNTFRSDLPSLNCRIAPYCQDLKFSQPQKILASKSEQKIPHDTLKISSLSHLQELTFQKILIEAGPKLQSQLLEQKYFDEISIILTPMILANEQKLIFKKSYGLNDALNLSNGKWITLDDNLLFHWTKFN